MAAPPPKQLTGYKKLLAFLAASLVKLLTSTYRVTVVAPEKPYTDSIFCFWHNQLLMPVGLYRFLFKEKYIPCPMTALVSASKDGAFLYEILERLGIYTIRGSSSRRGAQALVEARRALGSGSAVAITPDGPKGPPNSAKQGAIALARLTSTPIIPLEFRAGSSWRLKSWDKFMIPKPFTKIHIYFHQRIEVYPEDSEEEAAQLLTQILNQRTSGDSIG